MSKAKVSPDQRTVQQADREKVRGRRIGGLKVKLRERRATLGRQARQVMALVRVGGRCRETLLGKLKTESTERSTLSSLLSGTIPPRHPGWRSGDRQTTWISSGRSPSLSRSGEDDLSPSLILSRCWKSLAPQAGRIHDGSCKCRAKRSLTEPRPSGKDGIVEKYQAGLRMAMLGNAVGSLFSKGWTVLD